MRLLLVFAGCLSMLCGMSHGDEQARVALFNMDASPPIGSRLAYDETQEILIPLTCRGVILLGSGKPIVICSLDWIGVGNDGYKEFCETIAKAVGTTPDRVTVHALHSHDAPWCDFTVDQMIANAAVDYRPFDSRFAREVFQRAAAAASQSLSMAQPFTHLGLATAEVEKVASNRRILGPDGNVLHVRWSAVRDPLVRDFPEGVIDPLLRMISFWNADKPIVAMTYYATHPQSYYRTAKANPDFPGIARNQRQEATGVPHVHFNGAGGNITAGKYNDGAHENRAVLADRMADAMRRAWESTTKTPIASSDIGWSSKPVLLPAAKHLHATELAQILGDPSQPAMKRFVAAGQLAWVKRIESKDPIELSCLRLGNARVLHMPGELFIEYQLMAQTLRPDLFVAMAAYGDYGPAYIGTSISYSQGGYEVGPDASNVGPDSEEIIITAVKELLTEDSSVLK